MALPTSGQIYGTGSNSSIGPQQRIDYINKKVLQEAAKETKFGNLASVEEMPKNMGKKIKRTHILPVLSDLNINDQGIDAAGASVANEVTITMKNTDLANTGNEYVSLFAVGNGVDATAALGATTVGYASSSAADLASARYKAWDILRLQLGLDGSLAANDTYAEVKALAITAGWTVTEGSAVSGAGNLYGSSKDIGYITGKLPTLTENGGLVNRIGFKRIEIEGTFANYGFMRTYTQDSLDFDSDAELDMHVHREMIFAANELSEDMLQMDLLASAGVIRYGGSAISKATITGETGNASLITYDDLVAVSLTLDTNRCPMKTTMVTGDKMEDTRTINAARCVYISPALVPQLLRMVDNFGNQALIEVRHYANQADVMKDELGSIHNFRFVVCQEMLHWAGVGATASSNAGYRTTGGKYDVFPMLIVGDKSFTTIGFKSGGAGKGTKFNVMHHKPGSPAAMGITQDAYGKIGVESIQFWYGFMLLRSERIALLLTVAEQ